MSRISPDVIDRAALAALEREVERLRAKVLDLEHRLVESEQRTAEAETQLEMATIRPRQQQS